MSDRLSSVFVDAAKQNKTVFVAYLMSGFHTKESTVPTLLALQEGGADIIELGVPFTDPIADGPTIQVANQIALENKVTMQDCLEYVRVARKAGVTVPIVLMGYYNPILNYGEERIVKHAADAGANGFIVVDLPPEEAEVFRDHCKQFNMSYIPLICPTTSDFRIKKLSSLADSFIYCVSINGITGTRTELPEHLPLFVKRIRSLTSLPIAVGFGISTRTHFEQVGKISDGVVIGSAIVKALSVKDNCSPNAQVEQARIFAQSISQRG